VSTHIHIARLVLDNLDAPGNYPAVFAAEFTTALRDRIGGGVHRAAALSLGPDPVASARSAAAAAVPMIAARISTTIATGDTPSGWRR
jgi:hypothetical protein